MAFNLKSFSIQIKSRHITDQKLKPALKCDSLSYPGDCENNAINCVSNTTIELKFEENEHKHLCQVCTEKTVKK